MVYPNKTFVTLIVLLCLVALPAQATSLISMDIVQLSEASSEVITGKVVKQQADFDASGTRIYTTSTVEVEILVKGNLRTTEQVRVRQIGGEIGDTVQVASGMVYLRPEENVLLFLNPADNAGMTHKVTGFTQGIYKLQSDPVSQQTVAMPVHSAGVELFKVNGKGEIVESHQNQNPVSLNELIQTIRAIK